jgi:splicing factor 3A subunit 1
MPPCDKANFAAIVEKTAGYVARNPPAFEGKFPPMVHYTDSPDRFREKERTNPRFSFLHPNDAYNAFYAWRLAEVRAGRGTDISAGRVPQSIAQEPEKARGPPPPLDFQFSARMPNISAQDLDVVKLTALFVAKNGRQWMTNLAQREARNYQFDFLRPNHSLFQFFSRLVDQYTDLIRAHGIEGGGLVEKDRMREAERNIADKFHVLPRANQRAAFLRYQEQQKQQKEEAAQKEKIEYAQVDWHDFVVVETVIFTDADEMADLPAPTTLSDLQSASLEQKGAMSLAPATRRIEEAAPTGYETFYNAYGQPLPMHPAYTPQVPVPAQYNQEEAHTQAPKEVEPESAESIRIREQAEAAIRAQQVQAEARASKPMNIRSDYVPRAAAAAASRRGAQMAICPNCRQQIPTNELDEHMRSEFN